MRIGLRTIVVCLLLLSAIPAAAQFVQDPKDLGVADTIDIVLSVIPDATTNQLKLQADLWVFNDSNYVTGASVGFGWDNSNMQMDSATMHPVALDAFDMLRMLYEASNIGLTNANQRFLFGTARLLTEGVVPDPSRRMWASWYFTLSEWNLTDSVIIDTLAWDQGTELMFIGAGENPYVPYFNGRARARDTAYVVPSDLVVSEDTLYFTSVQGGDNPASQTFVVDTDADPLDFSLVENASWLLKSPSLGTTPQSISVSINNFGLTTGTYIDSISVVSATAANSPQQVVVVLSVTPPPPVIGVSETEFFFTAIAEGANPDDQALNIYNAGGQVLNWSVSNSESWLGVSPASGTDDGTVSLSIDVTGLGVGDYFDTVLVSDPAAANTPVAVEVWLLVASGLPEISVESAYNYVVVDLIPGDSLPGPPPLDVPPVTLEIRNAGGGLMNYWTEESSYRLYTVTPDSGSVPQDVEVTFRLSSGLDPGDYFDTLWVHSVEATNSPYPVVFQFHCQNVPAKLLVNRDTVTLDVWECMDGSPRELPTTSFQVYNSGQDNPVIAETVYESDLFRVTVPEQVLPCQFYLEPVAMNLPVGVYWDTLWVTAEKAINTPVPVVVKYNVQEPIWAPELLAGPSSINLTAQEDSGPFPDTGFWVWNRNYGCVDWTLSGNPSWAMPGVTSGGVPGHVEFVINPTGLDVGVHTETMLLVSPEATNSPYSVPITLTIWRLRGDCNFDGKINLVDITWLIRYVYLNGAEPKPALTVGDVNCDGKLNLADITYLIRYVYQQGPIPCGNPY